MTPVAPVIPNSAYPVTTYGASQPEYRPLPTFTYADGTVLSRWKLTWKERLKVLLRGDIYLWQLTFHSPLQPVMLQVDEPEITKGAET